MPPPVGNFTESRSPGTVPSDQLSGFDQSYAVAGVLPLFALVHVLVVKACAAPANPIAAKHANILFIFSAPYSLRHRRNPWYGFYRKIRRVPSLPTMTRPVPVKQGRRWLAGTDALFAAP